MFKRCKLKSTTIKTTSPAYFWLHIIQLLLLRRFTYQERKYTFSFAKGSYSDENGEEQIEKRTFAVCGSATMENLFSMVFKFQKFHNRSKTVFINGGSHLLIDITAPVRCEKGVNLSVQFDIIRKDIRPIESTLKPLGIDRNIFSDSRRVHALTLTYKFSTPKKNLKISAFLDLLHESYFKDFVGSLNTSTLFKCIRHHLRELLPPKYTLDVHCQINDTAEKPTGVENYLEKGEKQAVFIGSEYDYSVYPKDSKPGDLLLERLSFVNS
ncbi:hypothetical protein C2G38_2212944 [Gigaspora rosea]|uniref:Tripeptidyl peptidase II second Ig-like domain-containing protein n=1 Tax=Gigaspora rosea TaxID=44941 RepID=A0A397UE86_9GLOM|nr:hypothetical protein C2G38_2212944 [Gigaspora rosea]